MGTLSQAKTLGGVGSILVLLIFIPTAGVLLAIIGFIMTLIALKYIADYLKDPKVFNDALIAVVLAIIGFVVVGVIVAASVFQFAGLGSLVGRTVTPSTPGIVGLITGIVAGLVIGWIVLVVSSYFFRKAYNEVGMKLNVGMFKTAALIFFIGAILTILVIGLLLILIAQILLIVAFFSIPDMPMASGPGMPPPPPGSPTMAAQPGTPMAGTKFCVKCGANLAQDASFCPNCGASQPPNV